jgi:hypothetical protein
MLASARSVCSPCLDSPRSFSPSCQHIIINFVHISQLICRLSSLVDSSDGLKRPVHELMEFSDIEQLKVTQPFYYLQGPYVPPQIFKPYRHVVEAELYFNKHF